MDFAATTKLKLALATSSKTPEELHFLIESLCIKQRALLISLLLEEKENIEPFIQQNMWVEERTQVINSLLKALDVDPI